MPDYFLDPNFGCILAGATGPPPESRAFRLEGPHGHSLQGPKAHRSQIAAGGGAILRVQGSHSRVLGRPRGIGCSRGCADEEEEEEEEEDEEEELPSPLTSITPRAGTTPIRATTPRRTSWSD